MPTEPRRGNGPLDSRRAVWLVVASWAVLVACLLPVREVIPPDEPRFAHQAQNMFDLGDWIVPRIGDVPYPDKPPILFWAIDLASLPLGRVHAWTARVPSAVAALVILLLTVRLGRKVWGSRAVGVAGALVLATCFEFFLRAQWVGCDTLMMAFAFVALTLWREAAFDEGGNAPGGSRVRVLLGWVAAAAAVLTKGPPGILFPAFWLAAEAAARRSARPLSRLFRPEGPVAFLLLVGGWLWAAARAVGEGYSWNALYTQTVTRYLHAWNSVKPWYFYLYQTPVDLMPWTLVLPAAIVAAVLAWRRPANSPASLATRTASVYLALSYVFFTGSTGKRGVYVMPAFPAATLLVAMVFLGAGRPGGLRRAWREVPLGFLAALGLLLAAGPAIAAAAGALSPARRGSGEVGPVEISALAIGGAAVTAGALVALRLSRRDAPERALLAAFGGTAVMLVLAGSVGGAAWSRWQGGVRFGHEVAANVPRGQRIVIERGKFELILFYADRRGTEIETPEALFDELESGRCRYAILSTATWDKLRDRAPLAGMKELLRDRLGKVTYTVLGP